MNEWFRNFRLGLTDVIGITVPGIFLIVFTLCGFLLPLACLLFPLTQVVTHHLSELSEPCGTGLDFNKVASTWESNKALILLLAIILAYTLGYILRLVSPNRLDKESARIVLKEMEKAKSEDVCTLAHSGCGQG